MSSLDDTHIKVQNRC